MLCLCRVELKVFFKAGHSNLYLPPLHSPTAPFTAMNKKTKLFFSFNWILAGAYTGVYSSVPISWRPHVGGRWVTNAAAYPEVPHAVLRKQKEGKYKLLQAHFTYLKRTFCFDLHGQSTNGHVLLFFCVISSFKKAATKIKIIHL